jgi:enoyl-CoA hydratase
VPGPPGSTSTIREEPRVNYELPDELTVRAEGPIRIVTMNRPEARNAVNKPLHVGLELVWDQLADDVDARAVVLTGAGKAFSAGGDMDWFVEQHHDLTERRRSLREAKKIVRNQLACPLPIVAAVNGAAMGLGCSVALLCDYIVMADTARLADPHTAVGLVAGDGGALWPLFTSMLVAKQYVLLGDPIPADVALRIGLCNEVVPRDDVVGRAVAVAERFAELPPLAVRDTKRAMNMHYERVVDGIMDYALKAEEITFTTDEVRALAERFLASS